jgi:hypothetical protein
LGEKGTALSPVSITSFLNVVRVGNPFQIWLKYPVLFRYPWEQSLWQNLQTTGSQVDLIPDLSTKFQFVAPPTLLASSK